jgi:hypothetical protein
MPICIQAFKTCIYTSETLARSVFQKITAENVYSKGFQDMGDFILFVLKRINPAKSLPNAASAQS